MSGYGSTMRYKGKTKIFRFIGAASVNAGYFVNGEVGVTMGAVAMSLGVVMLSYILAVQVAARPGTREGLDAGDAAAPAQHNERARRGLLPFAVRRNSHSHLPHEHFLRTNTGYVRSATSEVEWGEFQPGPGEPPAEVDWRAAGAVTPVRDQGSCGSCWAFSAVGALEGQYFIKYGKLVPLSPQNLIDCTAADGTSGCGGGSMDNAFEYIRDNGGVDTEAGYPYEAVQNQCRGGRPLGGTAGLRVALVAAGDEGALRAAAAAGPLAVAVDASPPSFREYSAGVYYDPACSEDDLNHAMLLVGYGVDAGGAFWLLKNSWGPSWGLGGYMKLARDRGNHCGVASAALLPVL